MTGGVTGGRIVTERSRRLPAGLESAPVNGSPRPDEIVMTEREFWQEIRRGLWCILKAMESRYGIAAHPGPKDDSLVK